jgi:hypothetical protein
MAINTDFAQLDNISPSWADLTVKARGTGISLFRMKDLKAINTSSTVEIGEGQGLSGGRVTRWSTGAVKNEGSLTFYHGGYTEALRNMRAAAEVLGYRRGNQVLVSLVHIDLVFQWTPPGSAEIFETRLLGCRFKGRTLNGAEGVELSEVEVPLKVGELVDVVEGKEYVFL